MDKKNVYNEYGYMMKFNYKLSFNCKKNDAGFSLQFMNICQQTENFNRISQHYKVEITSTLLKNRKTLLKVYCVLKIKTIGLGIN
jgi:hypothetical protein